MADMIGGATLPRPKIDKELRRLDQLIRDTSIPRKDIAKAIGCTATGMYQEIRDNWDVKVATISFLVNARTGRPLSRLLTSEVEHAGRAAVSKKKPTLSS